MPLVYRAESGRSVAQRCTAAETTASGGAAKVPMPCLCTRCNAHGTSRRSGWGGTRKGEVPRDPGGGLRSKPKTNSEIESPKPQLNQAETENEPNPPPENPRQAQQETCSQLAFPVSGILERGEGPNRNRTASRTPETDPNHTLHRPSRIPETGKATWLHAATQERTSEGRSRAKQPHGLKGLTGGKEIPEGPETNEQSARE